MKGTENRKRWLVGLMLFSVLVGLVGCGSPEAPAGPRAWIDFPRDGASLPASTPVTVISHVYAAEGVAEVMLLVDGVAHQVSSPTEAEADFSEMRQEWLPVEPGLHTLQVRAYNAAGEENASEPVTVRVIGEVAMVPTEPGPTEPGPAEPRPTDVPPTGVPPTDVPPTDVPPTDVPPTDVPPTDVPPTATEPPDTPTPTIGIPTPVPDTTAPPVPTPYVPADGLVVDCKKEQELTWLPVQDDSGGEVVYRVVLQQSIKAGQWDEVETWEWVPGKQVKPEVSCGGVYRWRVRARDEAGNESAWSDWSEFGVKMN